MGKNIVQQARGKGGPRYRVPSFNFMGDAKFAPQQKQSVEGTVTSFVHCPGHNGPLAEIKYADGKIVMLLAPEGIKVGDKVSAGPGASATPGSVLSIKEIPEGTLIYNVELRPGDGGKFCRSSGTFARLLSKTDKTATIMLPSKKEKTIHNNCRAAIGIIAGGGRVDKPLLKAGKMAHKKAAKNKLYPRISGAAQNAVDHPFGNKRTSRKAKQKAVGHFAPPGRKVGKLWPRRTGRKN